MRSSDWGPVRLVLRATLFCGVMVIAGELFFRFAIVAANTGVRVRDREFGILLYDGNRAPSGVFTAGRMAEKKARWHINGSGWRSGWEYDPPSPARRPVIALLGDSYIVGFEVDEEKHLASVLRDRLGGAWDVYTFGQGGAPLSEFVWMMRYAVRRFDPAVFVVLLGDDDWRSSLTNYGVDRRVHQVTFQNGEFVDAPFPFEDRPREQVLKYSAIIRYLVFNANYHVADGLRRVPPELPQTSAEKSASERELERITNAETEFFMQRIAGEFPQKEIVFMVDGLRDCIYGGGRDCSQATAARLKRASSGHRNLHVLDLAPAEARRYAGDLLRFEFPFSDHWNEHGHEVVGETIAEFLLEKHIIGPTDATRSRPSTPVRAAGLK